MSTSFLHDKGCSVANDVDGGDAPKQGIVIMDYGQPKRLDANTWGASAFGHATVTTGEIRDALEAWGEGFHACLSSANRPNTLYRIAAGTSLLPRRVG